MALHGLEWHCAALLATALCLLSDIFAHAKIWHLEMKFFVLDSISCKNVLKEPDIFEIGSCSEHLNILSRMSEYFLFLDLILSLHKLKKL